MVGSGPHFNVEATPHRMNLFVAVTGQSAQARKGTSWGIVKKMAFDVEQTWVDGCVQSGLSSGEGLIAALKNETPDKRLTIVEPEFARVLRVMGRDGNVLSNVLREAWDGGDLRVLTRANPLCAKGGHVSLIVHITEEDLRKHLDASDAANGFANRFLWVLARRSQSLPEGGEVPPEKWQAVCDQLRDPIAYARQVGAMKRDEAARVLWLSVYDDLTTEEREGTYAAVTARAPAQVMRIACIYALLDGTSVVSAAHLQAALAIWRYCDASAKRIFSRTQSDVVQDKIKLTLRKKPSGLTRTTIRDLFQRNVEAQKLTDALQQLQLDGFAYRVVQSAPGAGRSAEVWMPTAKLLAEAN